MVAPFLHVEVLGPRADLDAWLATLQDVGVCHLADALRDLEGEAGIGRPALRAEEVHAGLLQSEAARALRGVARVLPPTPRTPGAGRRPDWTLGPGGLGEPELIGLKDEARGIATDLHAILERVRVAELDVTSLDAADAALAALQEANLLAEGAYVFRLPRAGPRWRRLKRRLEKLGALVLATRSERSRVLVVPGVQPAPSKGKDDTGKATETVTQANAATQAKTVGGLPGGALDAAAALGAEGARLPAHLDGLSFGAARSTLSDMLMAARGVEGEARAALTAGVSQTGARGRFLLDSLDDAEARTRARKHLASTEHVAAARVFVRPEDEPALRERMRAAHGDVVVLRPLAEADDAPTLPQRVADVPFAALRGLTPRRFGDVAPSSVLALLAPVAVGIVWADLLGGLLLLLSGGLLGWRARVGSPRRDTALLAQLGGFVALLLGALGGRALGAAGAAWFGTGWAVAPGLGEGLAAGGLLAPFQGVLFLLGLGAAVLALWGGMLAMRARVRGRPARSAAILEGALLFTVIAGLAAAGAQASLGVFGFAWLVPVGILGLIALGLRSVGTPHRALVRLGLELVGLLRLVAVGGGALLVCNAVFASWVDPSLLALVLGPAALLVAALAVVADPAHMAMGLPYDLSLGGRRLGRPFEPLRRRQREGTLAADASTGGGA